MRREDRNITPCTYNQKIILQNRTNNGRTVQLVKKIVKIQIQNAVSHASNAISGIYHSYKQVMFVMNQLLN